VYDYIVHDTNISNIFYIASDINYLIINNNTGSVLLQLLRSCKNEGTTCHGCKHEHWTLMLPASIPSQIISERLVFVKPESLPCHSRASKPIPVFIEITC
jgi:hypothetical protein